MNIKKIINLVKREGADAGNIKSAKDSGLYNKSVQEIMKGFI